MYYMINKSKILIIAATLCTFSAHGEDSKSRYYMGVSGGVSIPLKSKFQIKDEGDVADTKVKKSFMGTVNFGYRVAEGTAIEFAVDFKPKYPMAIISDPAATTGPIKTKATATIYMVNFVYDLAKTGNLQPYFVAGLGLADIRVKPGVTYIKPESVGGKTDFVALRLKKNNRIAIAFQMGVGAKYPINDVISFDMALKLQGITNVKLKYDKFSTKTETLKSKSTKQHLGVGEIVAGLIINF